MLVYYVNLPRVDDSVLMDIPESIPIAVNAFGLIKLPNSMMLSTNLWSFNSRVLCGDFICARYAMENPRIEKILLKVESYKDWGSHIFTGCEHAQVYSNPNIALLTEHSTVQGHIKQVWGRDSILVNKWSDVWATM